MKPRLLTALSVTYLSIPHVVFFFGWLRCVVAIPVAAFLTYAMVVTFRHDCGARHEPSTALPYQGAFPALIRQPVPGSGISDKCRKAGDVLGVAVVACGLLILSGVGGYAYQDDDWFKHNAMLRELIVHPWPVCLETPKGQFPLVYYVAYYLPAAVAGRTLGEAWASPMLFLWSLLGVILALMWLYALVPRFITLGVLMFFAFSGLDVVGLLVSGRSFEWHIEWWARHWSHASNVTLLFWVPQMAIPTWILSGLTVHSVLHSNDRKTTLLAFSLSGLWCPFIMLGLLPYLALDFWMRRRAFIDTIRGYVSVQNLCGLAVLVLCGLYFSAKFCDLPIKEADRLNFIFLAPREQEPMGYVAVRLVAFWMLECGIWAALIAFAMRDDDRRHRLVFATSVVILVVLPLFRYGYFNDLVMRVSMPALFVLCVLALRAIFDSKTPWLYRGALLAALTLGSITPLTEAARHVARFSDTPRLTQKGDLWSVQEEVHPYFPFILQYIGCRNTLFFKYVSRELR